VPCGPQHVMCRPCIGHCSGGGKRTGSLGLTGLSRDRLRLARPMPHAADDAEALSDSDEERAAGPDEDLPNPYDGLSVAVQGRNMALKDITPVRADGQGRWQYASVWGRAGLRLISSQLTHCVLCIHTGVQEDECAMTEAEYNAYFGTAVRARVNYFRLLEVCAMHGARCGQAQPSPARRGLRRQGPLAFGAGAGEGGQGQGRAEPGPWLRG
jgi:hypothetical protein